MRKNKLLAVMTEVGDSRKDLAGALGISVVSLSYKLNGHGKGFWQHEMDTIRKRYRLSAEQMEDIFFGSELSEQDTGLRRANGEQSKRGGPQSLRNVESRPWVPDL